MRFSAGWTLVIVLVALTFCSCKQERARREVFPVKGTVTVDGKPVPFVNVTANELGKPMNDPNYPVTMTGLTTEDGKFEMASYDRNDGLPAGEYALTFYWGEPQGMTMGPDKLNGRYQDPTKSTHKIKVEKAMDLGTIELTTK